MGKPISNKEFRKLYGKVIHEGNDCVETDKGCVIYKIHKTNKSKELEMNILNFIICNLCILFGCFTILCVGYWLELPIVIISIIGGIWGYIVGCWYSKNWTKKGK